MPYSKPCRGCGKPVYTGTGAVVWVASGRYGMKLKRLDDQHVDCSKPTPELDICEEENRRNP